MYRSKKDLEDVILRLNDLIYFDGLRYQVRNDGKFYCHIPDEVNSKVFKDHGIDENDLFRSVFGEEPDGGHWPYTNSLHDLTLFVRALYDALEERKKESTSDIYKLVRDIRVIDGNSRAATVKAIELVLKGDVVKGSRAIMAIPQFKECEEFKKGAKMIASLLDITMCKWPKFLEELDDEDDVEAIADLVSELTNGQIKLNYEIEDDEDDEDEDEYPGCTWTFNRCPFDDLQVGDVFHTNSGDKKVLAIDRSCNEVELTITGVDSSDGTWTFDRIEERLRRPEGAASSWRLKSRK